MYTENTQGTNQKKGKKNKEKQKACSQPKQPPYCQSNQRKGSFSSILRNTWTLQTKCSISLDVQSLQTSSPQGKFR